VDLNAQRLSIDDTSILVRSPFYPQWRAAVEKVFEQIDLGVLNGRAQALPNRLLVCTLPAGLPLTSGPLWPRLESRAVDWAECAVCTMLERWWKLWLPASHGRRPSLWSARGPSNATHELHKCRRPRVVALSFDALGRCAASFSSA